jgi:type I restriction enzyme S subunit
MIRDLPPYPAYKDSGVPWLGKVPEHWEVRRLKTAVDHVNQQTTIKTDEDLYIALEHVESWTGRLLPPSGEAHFDGQVKRFQAGDVLFGKLRPYLAKVVCPKQSGVCVGEFLVLRARPVVAPHYLEVALRSAPAIDFVNSSTYGAKMPRAEWTFVGAMLFPVPPLPEQTAIVRFLDYMDRRIRRSIRAKQKLIKLLEEYRQALIHQAVTGQIDVRTGKPYPTYKDSGVPWLGHVPEHWEVRTIKSLAGKGYKTFVDGDWIESPYIRAEGIRLIQTGNIGIGHYREKGFRFIDEETFVAFRCTEIIPGDVLICRLGDPVGRACLAPNLGVRMIASVDVCILKPNESAIAAFLVYAMSSPVYLEWIGSLVRGSTRDRVSRSMLGRFCVPLPPLPEQTAIVEYLDAETAKLDAAIAAARREIELLREYRERLIADVVTGKVDVRGVAAQLPEEPPDQEAGTEEEEPVADELATVDSQEEANGEE